MKCLNSTNVQKKQYNRNKCKSITAIVLNGFFIQDVPIFVSKVSFLIFLKFLYKFDSKFY